MKLQTLHENTGFSFNGLGDLLSSESIEKVEQSFSSNLKGMKQIGDRSHGDKWEGDFTDSLSTLNMVVWEASTGRKYVHFDISTNVEIVEFLDADNDSTAKYFSVGMGFDDEKELLDYLIHAPKVLAEQMGRFSEWHFDMSGEHGKLKLIKKGHLGDGVTFYAVGGKIENYPGASHQEEPEVY